MDMPRVSKKQHIKQLAWREYLPLAGVIAMWAVIVAALGHADAARLLAAVTSIRAIQNLTRLTTSLSLRQRIKAPRNVRRQAKVFAFNLQAGALTAAFLIVAALVAAMDSIGQDTIAAMLPFVALGMPARYLRFADVKTASPYFRLALAGSGLAMVLIGWAAGWQLAAMGLAFGAREWVAYAVLRWWPREPQLPKHPIVEPLRFAEIARNSAIIGRRMLTYRLSKTLLTIFGPLGNIAARTGRGLNLFRRLEPYIPHHLGGFVLASLGLYGGSAFLAYGSGEPAAMIGAAGLAQIASATTNVALLWHWLPSRDLGGPVDDDDDDE
jgi:hypothetical protein